MRRSFFVDIVLVRAIVTRHKLREKRMNKLFLILTLAVIPFTAFSAHHEEGEGAKEHGGKAAKSKEHGGTAAKSKDD